VSANANALDLLRSIDASLKQIVKCLQKTAPKAIASDRDLDGKYGDPVLKFSPRDWTGAPFKGAKFSQCPPDLLDMVAETLDYFGQKAEEANELTSGGKSVAEFKRADAARARGWAKRMRDGMVPVSAAAGFDEPASQWADDSTGF
jgi:hypothetical protein